MAKNNKVITEIQVGLGERSYPIYFGTGLLSSVGELARTANLASTVAVISNPTIAGLYLDTVRNALTASGFKIFYIEIPDGETYKSLTTLEKIYDSLVDIGTDRKMWILALGGGVVGDISGFAAASYLRGIPFVQVPTTLLAQVDSSVGGKTGVNHDRGKNLIGAFYQPRVVLIDVTTLDTLTNRDYLSGLAEVVKYGIILDEDLFSYLEENTARILARDRDTLLWITRRCCELKADVVEKDEREAGLRAVLNYGHTFGHAVEALTGYQQYTHGEAVAIGMVQAAQLAQSCGLAQASDTARIRTLIDGLGLPTVLPEYPRDAYRDAMLLDKKVTDGGILFVLNEGIGRFTLQIVNDLEPVFKLCGIGGLDGQ